MSEAFCRFEKMGGDVYSLSTKKVMVIGLGGVGGYVVEALARSGIGTLILVDHDVVTKSNINRQLIALTSTIGRKKVDVLKERVLDINPDCNVIILDMFYEEKKSEELFSYKIDFLVDACDTITSKMSLISSCIDKNIDYISCMGTGNRMDPSKIVITTLEKTKGDPVARILRKWAKDNNIKKDIPVVFSLEEPVSVHDRTPGSSAFVPSVAGITISYYIIKKFLDEKKGTM